MRAIASYFLLCRVVISLFSACSAVAACLIVDPSFGRTTALLAGGVFLLACGASALNQYQERDIDARMERTRRRPLPAGALAPPRAFGFGAVLILCGLALLLPLGPAAAILGVLSLFWYNGLYTPLKRKTAFAPVWGAPVGMLPPAIGWAAGDGRFSDPRLWVILVFFFLWQVPHFWLLLLRSGNDYERAGLPAITQVIPRIRLARIIIIWLASAAAVSLAFPLFGMVQVTGLFLWLVLSALVMTVTAALAALRDSTVPAAFASVNAFLFILLYLLSTDALIRGIR